MYQYGQLLQLLKYANIKVYMSRRCSQRTHVLGVWIQNEYIK